MDPKKQHLSETEMSKGRAVAQRKEGENRSVADSVAQGQNPIQRKPNRTGLPDHLKSGIENLSGHAMDDVKVHYNSSKPAQLNAHAYAQGADIHLASGQEKHLPHEAWHVVQQKQGRVKPTMQMKGKVNINDDESLEKEADKMGAKAMQFAGYQPQGVRSASAQSNYLPVIQQVKTEHAVGDLHYGISAPRYAGHMAMPDEAVGPKAAVSADNPVSVDELNARSGVTAAFNRGDGDHMRGYFDVIAMLQAHVDGSVAGKPGRWLDFLKAHLAYLSIDKHVAQIQSVGATAVAATKDRLNKNGRQPDVAAGETNDDKRDAIVAAHGNGGRAAAHAAYNNHVSHWVWDVFFRRTSKLGIDFTVQENKVIHMNTYGPARGGGPVTVVTDDAGISGHSRQPITHSELRHINRKYGADHARMDIYNKPTAGGAIVRGAHEGEMAPYLTARTVRIQDAFLTAVLAKTNLAGWNAITNSIFRNRPTGVNSIRTEINSGHTNIVKLAAIRATAHARIGNAVGRNNQTRAFYALLNNIPANINLYGQAGTSQEVNNVITNALKLLTVRVNQFNLT